MQPEGFATGSTYKTLRTLRLCVKIKNLPKVIDSTCSNFQNLRLVLDTTSATDSCIISIFHSIFVIPQAHSYVPSVAITSILVTAKILGVKFLNQHYKSPKCFALLSPLEQKFHQAVTRGSFRHIRNSHSIGTAYLRTRM